MQIGSGQRPGHRPCAQHQQHRTVLAAEHAGCQRRVGRSFPAGDGRAIEHRHHALCALIKHQEHRLLGRQGRICQAVGGINGCQLEARPFAGQAHTPAEQAEAGIAYEITGPAGTLAEMPGVQGLQNVLPLQNGVDVLR